VEGEAKEAPVATLAHQKWVEMVVQVFETILCFLKISNSLISI
jgi:hypothetical protein